MRRSQLPDGVREQMARSIVDRIAPKLGVAQEDQGKSPRSYWKGWLWAAATGISFRNHRPTVGV
jgi:hypothetical protein